MKIYFLFLAFLAVSSLAQENGFSYWWRSDGLIDSLQTEELDALSGDTELWCALAELYVGSELAEEAECVFEKEKPVKQKKKIWKVSLNSGANLDTNGNLANKFAKVAGRAGLFSADARFRENKGFNGTAALRYGIFYAKGGDLTSKHKGMLSEVSLGDLHLGGERLFRDGRDSSWVFGKFSRNFMNRKIYAGGNFRMVAPYYGGNRMWSRTWQGLRFWGWNFRATEIAVAKEGENTLYFAYLAERKKKGARLALEHDKNKTRLSAGFKPVIAGTDSLWASSEHPLRLKLGWDKKMLNVKVSNSLLFKETWKQGKPLEFRSESKVKNLTLRWAANFYKDGRIDLKQFYVEGAVRF